MSLTLNSLLWNRYNELSQPTSQVPSVIYHVFYVIVTRLHDLDYNYTNLSI